MAILKNRTKKENFLVVSKIFLQDESLTLAERGMLATMHSLPDNWNFSVRGMGRVLPDGEARISNALNGLEEKGYISRSQSKGDGGKFGKNIIEIFERPQGGKPCLEKPCTEKPCTEKPCTEKPCTENHEQYNNKQYSNKEYKTDPSINPSQSMKSDGKTDEVKEAAAYRQLIADNIHLDWLLEIAGQKNEDEVRMVNEIYEVICDMVCYPREEIRIKDTVYPWGVVKSQFLKLKYQHVAAVLNRLIDADLEIRNMSAYLISTLYTESLVGTMEAQAQLHDVYLKGFRGKPY